MGLPNRLHDASSDSIPILLVVAAAGWVSYLRSLLLCLLHSLGLLRLHPSSAAADDPLFSVAGSGLAGLVVVASSDRPITYEALPRRGNKGSGAALCASATSLSATMSDGWHAATFSTASASMGGSTR